MLDDSIFNYYELFIYYTCWFSTFSFDPAKVKHFSHVNSFIFVAQYLLNDHSLQWERCHQNLKNDLKVH